MRDLNSFSEIHLHRRPVDGRKWINGLAAIIESEMKQNPFGDGLFAFTNRRRDVVKIVYWNKSGFALWMTRLEEERFRWPLKHEGDTINITSQQLTWLLEGYDITRMKPHAKLAYSAVS